VAKAASSKKKAASKKPVKPPPKAPATKPKPTAPSQPLPPPPPPPPAQRLEASAPRDIGRLLRYGEKFGANKIDVQMLPLQLAVPSGAVALMDAAAPKSFRVFDRTTGAGAFRVMLSFVRAPDGAARLAAFAIHTGRPPIARWTVAHELGKKPPKTPDDIAPLEIASGHAILVDAKGGSPGAVAVHSAPPATTGAATSGPAATALLSPHEILLPDGRRALAFPVGGEVTAYWGVDAADKPVCLVVDCDAISAKDWRARAV
jgi:hypothetical protein